MKYGHFDDARRQYVIERPDTPLPWINYIGSADFMGLVSHTGGGYAYYRDAKLRRLTRFRYNSPAGDTDGRYLYLRDDRDGIAWSPTWQPMRSELSAYECRHGPGYSTIRSSTREIDTAATFFVPPGETLEVWSVEITNRRTVPANLGLFAAAEFCLWNALDDATNFQRNLNTGEVLVEGNSIFHITEYRERRNHFAYLASSEPPIGTETQRDAFLGRFRGWDRPIGIERGSLTGSHAVGGAPIAAHHIHLTLEPGETKRVTFLLGYHENHGAKFRKDGSVDTDAAHRMIERYTDAATVDDAFSRLAKSWEELLAGLQIATPDPAIDRMINTWNAVQSLVTFSVSRSASRYEAGIGRGIGFRDACQDLLGCVHMIPERARARLIDLASTQLPTGGAYHQYQPLTRIGNDDIGSGFNDDPLWFVLAVSAYLKETGDWSLLDEPAPYDNAPSVAEPLYDHLLRAVRYTIERCGPHGLPLIGRADWNDCLNLNSHSSNPDEPFQTAPVRDGDVAESVFIAGLFCLVSRELEEIARHRGDPEAADQLSAAHRHIAAAIETTAWDGDWYLRAYDACGQEIGAKENAEGRIYVEPQGICVMAGLGADTDRATRALDSVRELLDTSHGIALLHPPYASYRPELGEISSYPPGYKENGSVFCHTNPWIAIAECRLGRGDRAMEIARRISPAHREAQSDVHQCEPYVYAQTIVGPAGADHGRARNSWLTGTASWSYVAMTQAILGVRPELDGLRIDPCIPRDWRSARILRRFRGATYDIRIANPDGMMKGVRSITIDGTALDGTLLPVFGDGSTRVVDVILGRIE